MKISKSKKNSSISVKHDGYFCQTWITTDSANVHIIIDENKLKIVSFGGGITECTVESNHIQKLTKININGVITW